MKNTRLVEGVLYRRFMVRFKAAGKWRRMVRWSPGFPWVREEIVRELITRFGEGDISPGTVSIRS